MGGWLAAAARQFAWSAASGGLRCPQPLFQRRRASWRMSAPCGPPS